MARQIYQAIVDGILVGGVYALMAVGLTLIFGVLDIINIAQGVLVILGAYLSYTLSVRIHLDLFLGLLITVPVMFVIGVVIQWAFIRRLRGRERTSMTLLVTYAVALIIEGILYEIYGPNPKQLNASYVQSSVHVFGFYLSYIYLYGFALALVLVAAIYALLYRTGFGRSVRATMQDHTAARLIGIDVNRVAALTFGVGVAVTAAGGMMFGATNSFNPNSGYDLISRLLAIVILGGLGSIGGALVASVFMLTLESLVTIWSPEWAIVVFYAALVVVLVIRPTGFFGRQPVRAQRALPVELGVAADGGQRGAQLVRGVRGELPHLLLGLPACPERLLDPVEHRIDRPGQPPRLGVVARVGHPGGQVTPAGDHVGGARHPVERRQAAADQPAAAHREQGEQNRAGDQLGGDEAADLAAHRAVRPRDQQDAGARGDQALVVRRLGGRDLPPDRGQRLVARQ